MRYYLAKWDEEGVVYLCNQHAFIVRVAREEKTIKEVNVKIARFICNLYNMNLPNKNYYSLPL